jgi:hypothetical protein
LEDGCSVAAVWCDAGGVVVMEVESWEVIGDGCDDAEEFRD